MDNNALQALIDQFGERICFFILDNASRIYFGYKSSPIKSVKDLEMKTFGDVDMIGVPLPINNPSDIAKGITSMMWHPTACIQAIAVLGEGSAAHRIDPFITG